MFGVHLLNGNLIRFLVSAYCLFLSRFVYARLSLRFFRLNLFVLCISILRHKRPHYRRICLWSHVSALLINSFLHIFCSLQIHFLQSLFVYRLKIFLYSHFTDVVLLLLAFITALTTMIGAFCPLKSGLKVRVFFLINIHRFSLFYWWAWLKFPISTFRALARLFRKHILKSSYCIKSMRISLGLYLSLTRTLVSFPRWRLFCLGTCRHFKLTGPLHKLVENIILHDSVIQKL